MSSYTKIACPHCNKSLKIPEGLAGKTRSCPYCHGTIKIPAPSSSSLGFPDFTGVTTTAKGPAKAGEVKEEVVSGISNESASSDVSLVVSGGLGTAITVAIYLVALPLRGNLVGQLFWDRGWVPFATTFLFGWAVAILILKWLALKRQKESMLLDVLPTEISDEITIKSLNAFVKHIRSLPGSSSRSFLINRVLRGIEHFRVRKSAAETVTMMESQSAIDANNVAGSYSVVKVFIWSLPILGFIGTVIGVSAAVSSLASSLSAAGDMSAMKGALNSVFAGLGTAFDTTLLALILSMFVKIPTSAIQKSEEDLISAVDEYCNENFLRRLNDGREGGAERGSGGANASVFRDAVEAAMGTHHAELEKWLNRLDSLGGKLTTQMAESWTTVAAQMQEQQQANLAALQQQQIDQLATLQQQQLDQQAELREQLSLMAQSATDIQTALGGVAEQTGAMNTEVSSSFASAQSLLQEQFTGLEQGLNGLNSVLARLGEQTVVIQQVPVETNGTARKKTGWFSRFL